MADCARKDSVTIDLLNVYWRNYFKISLFFRAMVLRNCMKTFEIEKSTEQNETLANTGGDARMTLLKKHNLTFRRSLNGLEFELNRFQTICEPQTDVLSFWRAEECNFPTMAAVAKVLLCKPATSAASESAFSVAGALISSKRASLDPLRARKILFIHDNYDLLQEGN